MTTALTAVQIDEPAARECLLHHRDTPSCASHTPGPQMDHHGGWVFVEEIPDGSVVGTQVGCCSAEFDPLARHDAVQLGEVDGGRV